MALSFKPVVIERLFDVVAVPHGHRIESTFSARINGQDVWTVTIVGELQACENRRVIAALRRPNQLESIVGWIDVETGEMVGVAAASNSRIEAVLRWSALATAIVVALRALQEPTPLRPIALTLAAVILLAMLFGAKASARLARRLRAERASHLSDARVASLQTS